MKTVIITGCNGFIGKMLSEMLLKKNIQIIGLDISEKSLINCDKFIYFKLDFCSELFKNLSKYQIDVLYHLAWCGVSTIDKNDPEKQFVNIELTYNVLTMAHRLKVKKVIIPGSMSEFSKSNIPVTGYELDSPSDLYSAVKVAIRKISYQFCESHSISLNWLLITSVYGLERKDSNLITNLIDNLLDNKEIKTTKLEQKWDYIFIDDLITALWLIGEKGKENRIYPVGSGVIHPLSYYVSFIGEKIKKIDLIKIGALNYKNNFLDNSIPDITALEQIGFSCQHQFEEEIPKIIDNTKLKRK